MMVIEKRKVEKSGRLRFMMLPFLVVGIGVFLIQHAAKGADNVPSPVQGDIYKKLSLFGTVFDLVRKSYVDVPDDRRMIEAALKSMVNGLDPHSDFLNAQQSQRKGEENSGEFGGLGIEVMLESGLVKVVAPMDGTPAQRAGLVSGDLITKVNGLDIRGMGLNEAVDKMRGPVGSKVRLTLSRKGQESFEMKLVREKIIAQSVKSRVEADDIGYIRIASFTLQTQNGLEKALAQLKGKLGDKLKGYIIDLRNDPGGLVDQAVSVADSFLDHGEIVSMRSRQPERTQRYSAQNGDLAQAKPIVVLINGGSASAAEILAGALQDYQRATLVGTRSFGKGIVQTILPIGADQGALVLTTSRYYTPAGRSIQARGIDPDIVIEQEIPEALRSIYVPTRGEAGLKGHLQNEADGDEGGGSSTYVPEDRTKDLQLKAAIAILHGEKPVNLIQTDQKKSVNAAEVRDAEER